MIIRLAEPSDRIELMLLLESAFKTEDCNIDLDTTEQFRDYIDIPNQRTIVGIINDTIVATHTVVVEFKLLHNYGIVAHMEDLAVIDNFRNKGIAEEMLANSLNYCKQIRAYKILATCVPEMVDYYNRTVGFKEHEVSLRVDMNG